MNVKRTERGWGGHFICADRCLFRRNTLLELGDVAIVVSTVGAMKSLDRDSKKPETIGAFNRYYETMAFHAHKDGAYTEADVFRSISFDSPWSIDRWEDEDIDMQADAMHEAVVAEISERMLTGRFAEADK